MKRELQYPFFIECCKFAENIYWQTIFEDLAYGISPCGTFISNNCLTCTYKGKSFVYRIQKKSAPILYADIMNLFREKMQIMSSNELVKKKELAGNVRDDIDTCNNWAHLKKKNLKEILIEQFAISKRKEFGLTLAQARCLIAMVCIAIVFKVLMPSDIRVRNGIVERIEGFEFETGKIVLKKDIYNVQISPASKIVADEKSKMSDEWVKFIATLRKALKD